MQQQYDVIVVGAGGSGLAAAYSAAEHGGRVLVLEKQAQPGGTTGIAVGSYTAAGTAMQRAAGIDDNPQDHDVDTAQFARPEDEARNNTALRQFFLTEAAETLEWLRGLGLSFVGPSPEPPNRVPRMHNVVPGAKAYIATLQMAIARAGGSLVCNASVDELIQTGDRVTGVRATVDGQSRDYDAMRGVILAAGDYTNNPNMIAAHKGEPYRQVEGINPDSHGDGHLLAQNAGGKLVNMDITYGPELRFVPSSRKPFQQWLPATGPLARIMGAVAQRMPDWVMRAMIKRLLVTWQHPEDSLFNDGAIVVNRDGQRFVDETRWPDREIAVANQPDKIAYILLDDRLVKRYSAWPHFISTAPDIAYAYVRDYQRLRPDVTTTGDTLGQLGLPGDALEQTVAEAGQLTDGPWVLLGPVKAYFTTTEGGVTINQQMQVLDEQGDVIPGLYAVGQNGLGGMVIWGHGLHIAWAMTSGRLAGFEVMKDG